MHKQKVLLKELRESEAELIYIKYMAYLDEENEIASIIREADELIAIFTASTKKS
ncbi:MAG: hypothetical protein AAFQ37_13220 [Bacteroidota bacterium]